MKNIDFYKQLEPALTVKDYTVSKEEFLLKYNPVFDMLVTTPVPNKLTKYYDSEDYISHTDSKRSVFETIYQLVKQYTLKRKVALINALQTPTKTILDVGAGTGDFLVNCKKNNWTVFGVEPNLKAQSIAHKKHIYLERDFSKFEENQFDVITLWHVLEHVENLQEYIRQLKFILKPKGNLIIAVPNYRSYDATYYKNFWAAYDAPRHLWHFSQNSISKLFSTENMKVIKKIPMKFDAYYVSLLSEKYKTGKMNIRRAFTIGAKSNWKAKRTKEYSSIIYLLKNK